jgi:hypothetical protein
MEEEGSSILTARRCYRIEGSGRSLVSRAVTKGTRLVSITCRGCSADRVTRLYLSLLNAKLVIPHSFGQPIL